VTDTSVGGLIRHLRKARGLSLKEVAEQAKLSVGFISQVERGLSSPSLKVLAGLADALDVSIADFIAGAVDSAENGTQVVARVRDRVKMNFGKSGIVKELLTPFDASPRLDLYMMHLEPGAGAGDEPYVHQGIEAGLVLEGGFELEVDGRKHILGEGDSCGFSSSRPHRFRNAGRRKTRVIWVNYRDVK
jgi:transcriptional regulator with XRE-family HTH domain